jgi:hypothetical protein
MRWMVDGAYLMARVMERGDQCVAPGGVVSSVSRMVSAIASSPIVRGVPGLGSSSSPFSRCAAKRRYHLETVLPSAPTSAQIALFSRPAAAASTMRARRAIACPVLRTRASDSSSRLSASLSAIVGPVYLSRLSLQLPA